MSRPPLDLRGQVFGRLVARKRLPNGRWWCECSCGNWKEVAVDSLRLGRTRSCGCLQRQAASNNASRRSASISGEAVEQWLKQSPPAQRRVLEVLSKSGKAARPAERDAFKAALRLLYLAATGKEKP